jgi:hypothetical protein
MYGPADARTLVVIGRVREDVTAASMQAWLEVWLRRRFPPPSDATPVAVRVDSLATRLPVDNEAVMVGVLIMSMFGLVLLVAAANITNLMLARALARQPELVVRLALGASSWHVARQLIVESLVLAGPAAAAGLALVSVTARVVTAMIAATWPAGAPPLENILLPLEPDVRVMAFLAAMAVVSAVLITLAPAGRLAGMRLAYGGEARQTIVRVCDRCIEIGTCARFSRRRRIGRSALVLQIRRSISATSGCRPCASILRCDPRSRHNWHRRLRCSTSQACGDRRW